MDLDQPTGIVGPGLTDSHVLGTPPGVVLRSADHVREAFPGYEVEFVNNSKSEKLQRPFRITFPPFKQEEEQQKKGRLAKVRGAAILARNQGLWRSDGGTGCFSWR